MNFIVYILKCENDKYYVGKTEESIKDIYKKHLDGSVCEWTRVYKPLKLITVISPATEFEVDKYTELYMNKYGIENVRGGKYIHMNLDDRMLQYINNEILDDEQIIYKERLIETDNEIDISWDMVKDDFINTDFKAMNKYNNRNDKKNWFSYISKYIYK